MLAILGYLSEQRRVVLNWSRRSWPSLQKTNKDIYRSIPIMKTGLRILVWVLTLMAVLIFLAACVITISDGQGVLVFIFSIPAMAILLFFAILLSRKMEIKKGSIFRVDYVPLFFVGFLILFFVFAFIPGLRSLPDSFLGLVGKTFTYAVGKTPYAFFKDRASFPNKLAGALNVKTDINFSDLDVSFAWDKVCIFGPYTNSQQAKQVLNLDWNIEERSQIHNSDSINALVFLYQGSVNQVVDLKRGVADFKNVDICLSRERANFEVEVDPNKFKILKLVIRP